MSVGQFDNIQSSSSHFESSNTFEHASTPITIVEPLKVNSATLANSVKKRVEPALTSRPIRRSVREDVFCGWPDPLFLMRRNFREHHLHSEERYAIHDRHDFAFLLNAGRRQKIDSCHRIHQSTARLINSLLTHGLWPTATKLTRSSRAVLRGASDV